MGLRKIIFSIIYYSGFGYLLYKINKLYNKAPIILFHRITPEKNACWPPMHPGIFENTIRLLSKYYKFCSLDDFLNHKGLKKKNMCCIVFDDGYYDFKQYALPVLVKYKVPVTLFIPTESMDTNKIWNSEIDAIILQTEKSKNGKYVDIEGKRVDLNLNSEKDLFHTASAIKIILMNFEAEKRNILIQNLRAGLINNNIEIPRMLSWQEISEMKLENPELINIQSHTHTHAFLPPLNNNSIESEIEISKRILENKKINPIDKIAYPIGGYDENVISKTKKHYAYAFAANNQLVDLISLNTKTDYKYHIPRINISDNTSNEVFLRINGFHKLMQFV